METPITAVLSFLLILIVSGTSQLAAGASPFTCSSSCGDLNISYPFRLRDDPPECGETDYELVCEGSNAVLRLDPQSKYYVAEISYGDNAEIRVVDANAAAGNCTLPRDKHLLRDFISRDSRFRWETDIWASFINCSEKIRDRENCTAVPCLSGDGMEVYVVAEWDADSLAFLPPSCRFLAMVPVEQPLYTDRGQDVFELLQMGFSLWWYDARPSQAQIISKCFRSSTRIVRDDMKEKNTFNWMLYPFSLEIQLLECLNGYKVQQYKYSDSAFRLVLMLIVLSDFAAFLIVIRFISSALSIYVLLALKFWEMLSPIDIVEKFLQNQEALSPTRYSYHDIIVMTNNFREKLGQGGFGSVFKGILPGSHLVAVKMLGNSNKLNGEEFISEVSTIGRIHHANIVRLVGFCSEGEKRALIYEYMANGSLDKHIFSLNGVNRRFTMEKLKEIALGVARGIDYLHQGCDMRILHFDIKPHNILLDDNFNPKVSDFGLAKLYPKDYSLVFVSAARGTIGYIAPELVSRSFGVVSYKADVYSFGMLLMEMAGGRRNVDPRAENPSQVYYPSWIYDRLEQKEEHEISDANEIDNIERKLCKVGLWCIQMRPLDRPSMSRVIELLESEEDTLQLPPKPFVSNSQPVSFRLSCMNSSFTELSIISESEGSFP